MPVLLVLLSVFTCLVSGWMGTMFLILRHPQYLERAAMSLAVFVGAGAVAAGGWRGPIALRSILGIWAAALLALGLWALVGSSGDDGWVLIAGLLFAAEGVAVLVSILRASASAGTA
jgi:hypothetical protein